MKRILIGIPLKCGLRGDFMPALLIPGYEIDVVTASGGSVAMARDELAHTAVMGGYGALVMIDSDMRWTAAHLLRLLNHDTDIVAGVYCKAEERDEPYWLFKPWSDSRTVNGLRLCSAMALGFSKISVAALKKIRDATPELAYYPEYPESQRATLRHNWFPTGVINKRLLQEDYSFCRLAQRAGISIHADTGLVIPHIGQFDYAGNPLDNMPEPDLSYEQ